MKVGEYMNEDDDKVVKKYLTISPFNYVGGDYKFTACVGQNGGYDQTTIYNGFVDSVNTLLKSVATYDNVADPMVYPILFCLRHSFELFLKKLYSNLKYIKYLKDKPTGFRRLLKALRVYDRLNFLHEKAEASINKLIFDGVEESQIEKYRERKEILQKRLNILEKYINELHNCLFKTFNDEEYTHDLNDLIGKILSVYNVDNRISIKFDKVLPLLKFYKDIDPKGDAFRYWMDKDGNPHFQTKNIGTVRLDVVAIQFKEIIAHFYEIELEMYLVLKEYKTGTFTKGLSRLQIEEISLLLPKENEFIEKIKESKLEIKQKYNIGSKEFDNVLKIIRAHREFSSNIGLEKQFMHISNNALELFAKCAVTLEDWKVVSKFFTNEELNLLFTFSDIYGWRYEEKNYSYFSENLSELYNKVKNERRITCHDINPKSHIKYVILGMEKCGQIAYAEKLKVYLDRYTRN